MALAILRRNAFSSTLHHTEIIMKQQDSICPVCYGGHKQSGTTTFTVELGFGVVVVRDVPAQVCDLCGADWLEDYVAEKLELIVEQARRKHPVVEVANWKHEVQALAS